MKSLIKYYLSSFTGLPRNAWLLSLVVFINRSGSMVLFFLSLYLTKELGYSISTAGTMISIYGVGSLLGALLGGLLSDKLGNGRVMFLSLFFSGFAFITLGLMRTPFLIGTLVFISAVTNESFRPANAAAFADACPVEVRARGFVLNRMAINLGMTIGPAVGGFLALISYSYLFWVDGLTCIAAAVVFQLVFRHDQQMISKTHQTIDIASSPLKDKTFLLLLILLLGTGLCFIQLFNTWPLYNKEVYGFREDLIGILLAINCFLVVLIEMPIIRRLESVNNIKVMALGAFLLFGGFAILPYGSGFGYAVFAVIVWTFGEILIFPLTSTFVANRSNDRNRGKYMGVFTFTFSTAYIIGPYIGTNVYQLISKDAIWHILGVMGILTTIGFLMLEKRIRKEQ